MVDVGTVFPAGVQPAVLVQPADGAFDRPAVASQTGAVRSAAPGDDRGDAEPGQGLSLRSVVVAAVSQQVAGAAPGSAAATTDRWDRLH